MLIAVQIASFAVEAEKNTPVVILQEIGAARTIAVPVASPEASAIAIKSLNVFCDKPLTVDLLKIVIDAFGGKLDKVVVRAASGGFSSRLYVYSNTAVKVIECGCGDGIALAMRCSAPMFVDEEIFAQQGSADPAGENVSLRREIRSTATLEFGSYQLQ